jgi:hypothetical protein
MIQSARLLFTLGCVAFTLLALPSCSSTVRGSGAAVTKVKTYHLQPTERVRSNDPSIQFERSYHLYGTVTLAEQMERAGQYYTFFWKTEDRTQPVSLRFEYRQSKTGLTVKVKEEQVSDIRRSNISRFSVIGPEYQADGAVNSWRLLILRGKDELVEARSYLWK